MDDLVTWLRAQLDEDERIARAAADYGDRWRCVDGSIFPSDESRHPGALITGPFGGLDDQHVDHVVRHDPARVLAEVDAKRRILHEHSRSGAECRVCCGEPYIEETWDGEAERTSWNRVELPWPCPTLRLLALPYADRPGYRDEWKPQT